MPRWLPPPPAAAAAAARPAVTFLSRVYQAGASSRRRVHTPLIPLPPRRAPSPAAIGPPRLQRSFARDVSLTANYLSGWRTIRPYALGVSPRATLPELRLTDESSTFRAKLVTQTPANVIIAELILNKNHTKSQSSVRSSKAPSIFIPFSFSSLAPYESSSFLLIIGWKKSE